jgi:hypothetical protein
MTNRKFFPDLVTLGAAGVAAAGAYQFFIRPWHMRWGATTTEVTRTLPGDALVSNPKQVTTRAVTIRASAANVWPWLVQLGQGRGGFYTYDWMENLIGCDIHSADRILPEHQQLAVGDRIRLGPEGYPFYTVAGIEPGRALILRADAPEGEEPPIDETWLFYLDEIAPDRTRLIVRNRRDYEPTLGNFMMWRVLIEPLHFIMEQRMLDGIKARAEKVEEQEATYLNEPSL